MHIRPIKPADDAALKAVIQATIHEFHNDVPGSPYFDPHLGQLAELYADPATSAYWVVVDDDDQVLGGGGFGPYPYPDTVEVQKLYLTPAARGHGFGHKLVDMAAARAKELGLKQLYIETFHNYTAARGLYEHLGFKQIPAAPAGPAHPACDTFYLKQI
ncbi:GNAT family N-acetyltransferase [Lacticaseibacillus zhaodongensis]|uniref:GNAT family N-acetyltransferase n=1 Tax=Lacticaseibacillus zhaodongensis TaxID=2668065 RepID=UPI0012D2A768|nr:GNAT family N-acetyltransferase [Lacticaseibacillus zhaodongensis]